MVDDLGGEAFFFCCLGFLPEVCCCLFSSTGVSPLDVFCFLEGGSEDSVVVTSFGWPFVSDGSWSDVSYDVRLWSKLVLRTSLPAVHSEMISPDLRLRDIKLGPHAAIR